MKPLGPWRHPVDEEQQRRIAKLEAVVLVLIDAVVESGALSADDMNERLRKAVAPFDHPEAARDEPEAALAASGGYRSPARPTAAAAFTLERREPPVVDVVCIDCARKVPSNTTLVTASGPLCAACNTKRLLAAPG